VTPRRAKIVTVSDGVAAGTREDRSGTALAEALSGQAYEIIDHVVCPDEIDRIASTLCELTRGFFGLIVTTGGTGFAPRDVTPEATLRVVERCAPGLAEAMRAANPLGRLSRGTAGTRGNSLILNVPGSPSGAVECLQSVLDVLPHALELLAGTDHPHPSGN
jgi:molybdenum cofactor synthesis domain-containing protein